jgi:3-deoxy-manno-octulosonate cytidylyltransferase (CMP-KDO synthetase)
MPKRRVVAVIPARMESSRFPGKPLAKILDLPMVEMVRRRACLSDAIDEVFVATCNQEIIDVVEQCGGKAILTANTHERCTDRVEEAMQNIEGDIVVIVQGDEPLLDPVLLDVLIEPMARDNEIKCTNMLSIIQKEDDLSDIDIVKAVINRENFVMYYSRSPIPHMRVQNTCSLYRQTGLSAFTKSFLQRYSKLPATPLEVAESVDFLRILEHGHAILGVIYDQETVGVDRSGDIEKVERILNKDSHQWELYQKTLNL